MAVPAQQEVRPGRALGPRFVHQAVTERFLGAQPTAHSQVCFYVLDRASAGLRHSFDEPLELDPVLLGPGRQLAGVAAYDYFRLAEVELGVRRGNPAHTGRHHANGCPLHPTQTDHVHRHTKQVHRVDQRHRCVQRPTVRPDVKLDGTVASGVKCHHFGAGPRHCHIVQRAP